MKKAGGIIALISGIFGTIAALVTLFLGGVGTAVEAGAGIGDTGSSAVLAFGFGGLIFSFLTIILAAVTMGAKGRIPGILLIVCSIAGAILGGTFVAVCMVLAFVGGILALFGNENKPAA